MALTSPTRTGDPPLRSRHRTVELRSVPSAWHCSVKGTRHEVNTPLRLRPIDRALLHRRGLGACRRGHRLEYRRNDRCRGPIRRRYPPRAHLRDDACGDSRRAERDRSTLSTLCVRRARGPERFARGRSGGSRARRPRSRSPGGPATDPRNGLRRLALGNSGRSRQGCGDCHRAGCGRGDHRLAKFGRLAGSNALHAGKRTRRVDPDAARLSPRGAFRGGGR